MLYALLAAVLAFVLLVCRTAPITNLTGVFAANVGLTISQTLSSVSSSLASLSMNPNITGTAKFTSVGTGANQVNQAASKIYSIAASSSTTIDMSAAITNLVNNSTATFARVKVIMIRLLSTTDDATNGTLAASITVGNAASNQFISQSGSGFLSSATSTEDIPNGGGRAFWCSNANGVVIDGTHKNLKIANNDAGLAAAVEVTLVGADS